MYACVGNAVAGVMEVLLLQLQSRWLLPDCDLERVFRSVRPGQLQEVHHVVVDVEDEAGAHRIQLTSFPASGGTDSIDRKQLSLATIRDSLLAIEPL